MPIWKLQVEWAGDSILPRDSMVITPHFDDGGLGTDPQSLCEDLAEALSLRNASGPARQIKVTAYDAQGTPPVYPAGEAVFGPTLAPASTVPREVALCLSFFSERNIPTQRGRLFIPVTVIAFAGPVSVRPSPAMRLHVMAHAEDFTSLGGPDVDWVVYSRKLDVAFPVTDYWVDDEWDTIRSRGLRATTREMATTEEA